jgi:hypothetical protein
LGAGAWVAAVVSGTRPALAVIPAEAPGSPIEPDGFSLWRGRGGTLFALFALPTLAEDTPYRVEFWTDADRREAGDPPVHVTESVILTVPERQE